MISLNAPADASIRVSRQPSLLLSQLLRKVHQRGARFWGAALSSSTTAGSGGTTPHRDASVLAGGDYARDENATRELSRASFGSDDRARNRRARGWTACRAFPVGVYGRGRPLGKALLTSVAAASRASETGGDAVGVNAGVKVCGAAGWRVRGASTLTEAWAKGGVAPNHESYRAAIQACGDGGRYDEAAALLAEMAMIGLVPDVHSYNAALGACANAGWWEQALQLLRKMRAKGVEPDIASYNAVLTACGNAEQLKPWIAPHGNSNVAGVAAASHVTSKSAPLQPCAQQALSLLREMWNSGGVTPNDESYGACITALGNSGRQWEGVMALMREVKSKEGVAPGARSYTAAIKAGINGYRWRQTLGLLREMREREGGGVGMRATRDTAVYNAAIAACKNGGGSRHALSLLEDMRSLGVRRDVTSYNESVRALRQRLGRRRRPRRRHREEDAADTS